MKIQLLVLVLAAVAVMAANPRVSYSQFLEQVRAGEVASVVVTAKSEAVPVTARLRDGRSIDTMLPGDYRQALAQMQEHKVNIEIIAESPSLVRAAPFLLLLGVWAVLLWLKPHWKLRNLWRSGP